MAVVMTMRPRFSEISSNLRFNGDAEDASIGGDSRGSSLQLKIQELSKTSNLFKISLILCEKKGGGEGEGGFFRSLLRTQDLIKLITLQRLVPMRQKEIHGLKVHKSIKFAVDFALSKMSDKMRKRVFLHKSVEDVKTVISPEMLPLEYGGKIPMNDMISMFKLELDAMRSVLLSHDQMQVKLELYPQSVREGSVRSLKNNIDSFCDALDLKQETYGVNGSFRKLEID